MAGRKEAVSFDAIIQAGRKRKQDEELAQELLGSGRRTGPMGPGHKQGTTPSLASRAGISKTSQRSSSNTPKPKDIADALRGIDTQHGSRRPRVIRPTKENPMSRAAKNDLLYQAAVGQTSENGSGVEEELSIRGSAGPYVVIGSNFAPGTTAEDLRVAMKPVGGEMQSCRILTSSPTVMGEMVFDDKENADRVIDKFNNAKADGRVLYMYLKRGPPSAAPPPQTRQPPTGPRVPAVDLNRSANASSYDNQREQSDRSRRRAEPEIQDASYGFIDQDSQADQMDVEEAPVPVGATPPRSEPQYSARKDIARAYEGRDDRYAPRNYGRGRYDDRERDRGGGRPGGGDDRHLYSDNLYQRPRGRGFR